MEIYLNQTKSFALLTSIENAIHHVGTDFLEDLNHLLHARFLDNLCINEEASTTEAILKLNQQLRILFSRAETTTFLATTTEDTHVLQASFNALKLLEANF